jgi:hypothetical protein
MAIAVSELIEMRDNLIRARAKGVKVLQLNGERVEYRSDAEMAAAINALNGQIEAAQGEGGGFSIGYATTGRGL